MSEEIWIDFEKLPTDALEALLRNDCLDPEKTILSDTAILQICKILAQRRQEDHPGNRIDVEKKWNEFLKYYLGEDA